VSGVDQAVDRAAAKLRETADSWAAEGGVKAKVAELLAEDAVFLPKLKPSLIAARARGEMPTNEAPNTPRAAPAGPQLRRRPRPKRSGGGGGGGDGGPNPFLVLAVALAAGIALAKFVDWRGHAHPKD
jgi:hypothetical protein